MRANAFGSGVAEVHALIALVGFLLAGVVALLAVKLNKKMRTARLGAHGAQEPDTLDMEACVLYEEKELVRRDEAPPGCAPPGCAPPGCAPERGPPVRPATCMSVPKHAPPAEARNPFEPFFGFDSWIIPTGVEQSQFHGISSQFHLDNVTEHSVKSFDRRGQGIEIPLVRNVPAGEYYVLRGSDKLIELFDHEAEAWTRVDLKMALDACCRFDDDGELWFPPGFAAKDPFMQTNGKPTVTFGGLCAYRTISREMMEAMEQPAGLGIDAFDLVAAQRALPRGFWPGRAEGLIDWVVVRGSLTDLLAGFRETSVSRLSLPCLLETRADQALTAALTAGTIDKFITRMGQGNAAATNVFRTVAYVAHELSGLRRRAADWLGLNHYQFVAHKFLLTLASTTSDVDLMSRVATMTVAIRDPKNDAAFQDGATEAIAALGLGVPPAPAPKPMMSAKDVHFFTTLRGEHFTKKALETLIDKDVPFPFDFILFRPHMERAEGTAIVLKAGAETCETLVERAEFTLTDDPEHKVHYGNFQFDSKVRGCAPYKPRHNAPS